MKLFNEFLSKYTTLKIGGPCEVLSMPDNVEELMKDISYCRLNNIRYRILGNGSNLLIDDLGVRGYVIKLNKCCNSIKLTEKNKLEVGAGVLLSSFIKFSLENNLYGNEFLSSVPGTIGGAIFMNAGTWIDKNLFISDYLISVKYFDGVEIKEFNKEECCFGYRSSIFHQNEDWIILEAIFKLPSQPKELGEKKRKERLEYATSSQDLKYPNAGSIFCKGNGKLLRLLMGVRWGKAGWSRKTLNWINVYGKATSNDVYRLITFAKMLHFVFLQKIKVEIRIWK
jgi:UDP-N-acetylmuramate dehydrogenase